MFVQEFQDKVAFAEAARSTRKAIQVAERALAIPVREQGGVVVRPAIERHYTVTYDDQAQGTTRLVFVETLVQQDDGQIPFGESALGSIQESKLPYDLIGHVSGSHG